MSVRTLVVDDSATMRRLLADALASEAGLEVVGTAADAYEARAMIKALCPDVMTLDIEMPRLDGLSFLEKVMTLRPMPVVMCSSATARGADATIEALRLGAVACFLKPATPAEVRACGPSLAQLLRDAVHTRVQASVARPQVMPLHARPSLAGDTLLAIGASTGGVEALFTILGAMPRDCPPTIVVQHMPRGFTASFARRLNECVAPEVVEATDCLRLRPGLVAIAPGGDRHVVVEGDGSGIVRLRHGPPENGHCPSVDVLFRSVAQRQAMSIGVILTGMGCDGAAGLLAMRQAGAPTFGQSEESCVVYGMPRAAMRVGAIGKELPLTKMAPAILEAMRA